MRVKDSCARSLFACYWSRVYSCVGFPEVSGGPFVVILETLRKMALNVREISRFIPNGSS